MNRLAKFERLQERFGPLVDLENDTDADVEWMFDLEEHDRMAGWVRWSQIEKLRDETDEKNAFLLGVSLIHLRRVIDSACERADRHFYAAVTVEGCYDNEDPPPARHFACLVVPYPDTIPWNPVRLATGKDADRVDRWLAMLDDDLVRDLRLVTSVAPGDPRLVGGGTLEPAVLPCDYLMEPRPLH